MPILTTDTRAPILKKAQKVASRLAPAAYKKQIPAFFDLFFRHAPVDDLLEVGEENLAKGVLEAWDFTEKHPEKSIKIRSYNPDWDYPYTIIEILNDDKPFIVDSVMAELARLGIRIYALFHPTYRVVRDKNGVRQDVVSITDRGNEAAHPESLMQIHIAPLHKAEERQKLEAALRHVLEDVQFAVEDWRTMRSRAEEVLRDLQINPPPLPQVEIEQAIEFMDWVVNDKFTFLGYREYTYEGKGDATQIRLVDGSGLGLTRKEDAPILAQSRNNQELTPAMRAFLAQPTLLLISKTKAKSTVHRPVAMDSIGIKIYDKKGNVTGEKRFFGLFTSVAYSLSASQIPILRQKIAKVFERSDFLRNSHNGKALTHILENFPRDELFQINDEDLYEISTGILHLRERQRVALFMREDPFQRFVSCFIYIPREFFNTTVRLKSHAILANALGGEISSANTEIGDSQLARMHVVVNIDRNSKIPTYDVEDLEAQIAEIARRWEDDLIDGLFSTYGQERGEELARRYGDSFPVSYQEHHDIDIALQDIEKIETCLSESRTVVRLYQRPGDDPLNCYLKIYSPRAVWQLSEILPKLQNMGMRGLSEIPYTLSVGDIAQQDTGPDRVWVQEFHLRPQPRAGINASIDEEPVPFEFDKIKQPFEDLLQEVLTGQGDDDTYNRLILTGEVNGRQINILRSYGHYLKQANLIKNHRFVRRALWAHTTAAVDLIRLFETRFVLDSDPRAHKNRGAAEAKIVKQLESYLEGVKSVDEDRVIRRLLNVIQATARTNYYQTDADGKLKPYASFKLMSGQIFGLPKPVPMAEIFVYSPRLEAIHLRGGKVARGGLRWSDRLDDFRTEVLALMRAQMVKNAVIVPVGAKGGFIVKNHQRLKNADQQRQEVVDCYKTFIRGLLDITDNLNGDKVLPPRDVVRHDEDDPYLVVAADKGTATFSDIANAVAVDEYNFWLGDAFASGGSKGYSHKDMGITARGAWESVKRHFWELGVNTQTQDFTVVGVGDMAGDVFGNGMLLSRHIRLQAAFNHMHIFVDPTPDAARSFEERQRLFETPRTTWMDYDAKALSKGGAIYERSAKKIKLTPQIQKMLGLEEADTTPTDLIRELLKMEVDLLWFGGIGTFVKSPDESHTDVEDHANDSVRVNGDEVRAKVVGEGANLGFTQAGRIAYSLTGGLINTDFIDNSGGVDCSDHEVNMKISLDKAVKDGTMTGNARDKLLVDLRDDVTDLVLRSNYLQSQTLSLERRRSLKSIEKYRRLIRTLEREGLMNAAFEGLPDEDEIGFRLSRRLGFTRPELAILMPYAKIHLYDALLASDLPDDPQLESLLLRYFPEPMYKKYGETIKQHKLRREIITTMITNSIMARSSIPFVNEMREQTNRPIADIVRAFTIVRDVFNLADWWSDVEAADRQMPAETLYQIMDGLEAFAEKSVLKLLRLSDEKIDSARLLADLRPLVQELSKDPASILPPATAQIWQQSKQNYQDLGLSKDLAARLAGLPYMEAAFDLLALKSGPKSVGGFQAGPVAQLYFMVGQRFYLDELRQHIQSLPADTGWQHQASADLLDGLANHQAHLTQSVLAQGGKLLGKENGATAALQTWTDHHASLTSRLDDLMEKLHAEPVTDLSAATVIIQHLSQMAVAA